MKKILILLFLLMVGRIMALEEVHPLIPTNCEYMAEGTMHIKLSEMGRLS